MQLQKANVQQSKPLSKGWYIWPETFWIFILAKFYCVWLMKLLVQVLIHGPQSLRLELQGAVSSSIVNSRTVLLKSILLYGTVERQERGVGLPLLPAAYNFPFHRGKAATLIPCILSSSPFTKRSELFSWKEGANLSRYHVLLIYNGPSLKWSERTGIRRPGVPVTSVW